MNSGSSSMSMLIGNGDGTFRPPLTMTVGNASGTVVAVGDVNLDGNPDIITDDQGSVRILVLLGKGDGTFQAPIMLSGVSSGLAIGDFNGDGKPDLASTDFPGARVIIWTGHGDGTFSNPTPFSGGAVSGTRALATTDLNKDGKLDLVLVNFFSSNLSVLLGNGDGSFRTAELYPLDATGTPQSIATADINGDGIPDIVVGLMGGLKITAFLGVGDGSLTNSGSVNMPRFVEDVALGDVNGDGKMDVIAATNYGSTNTSYASILLGNGNGTFGAPLDFAVDFIPISVAVADFNHDGRLDLVTADQASTGATVLLNTTIAFSISRSTLNFGYSGQLASDPQSVTINIPGGANVNWTATSNQPNIMISPGSGKGAATFQISAASGSSGTVTITVPGAINSPQQIHINVAAVAEGTPFGSFETPGDNSTGISGAVAVTGWALDNVEVTNVDIWREPVGGEPVAGNGLVFIGNAVFVADARPDVQGANPTAPFNYQAGWGYLMLTTFLPANGGATQAGNGTYKLHAIAHNKAGISFDLGTKTITVDNAHSTKPFGTVDTPDQGSTVSGTQFINFGWALAQNPECIPTDGSTLTVIVDGVALGHPIYNQGRSDLASAFPDRCNTAGAAGYFFIDTTKLSNGVHAIAWLAYDDHGNGDGLGSRFFNVLNSNIGPVDTRPETFESFKDSALKIPEHVELEELERFNIPIGAVSGYLESGEQRLPLPIGSTLRGGVFYWQLGPGFQGSYPLVFERADGAVVRMRFEVRPKRYNSIR